jgi:hypothetical protein
VPGGYIEASYHRKVDGDDRLFNSFSTKLPTSHIGPLDFLRARYCRDKRVRRPEKDHEIEIKL